MSRMPQSQDRLVFQRTAALVCILFVLAAAGALIIVERLGSRSGAPNGRATQDPFREDESAAQDELRAALEVARDTVMDELGRSRVAHVEWVATRHEGNSGWYRFEGEASMTDTDGQVHWLEYGMVVSLDSDDDWLVEEVEVSQ